VKRQIIWLGAGVLLGLAPAALLLLAGLFLPVWLAGVLDRAAGRQPGSAALLFAAAGAIGPAMAFLRTGASLGGGWTVLTDPTLAGPCWLGAGLGWSLDQLLPWAISQMLHTQARARHAALSAARARYFRQWQIDGG